MPLSEDRLKSLIYRDPAGGSLAQLTKVFRDTRDQVPYLIYSAGQGVNEVADIADSKPLVDAMVARGEVVETFPVTGYDYMVVLGAGQVLAAVEATRDLRWRWADAGRSSAQSESVTPDGDVRHVQTLPADHAAVRYAAAHDLLV